MSPPSGLGISDNNLNLKQKKALPHPKTSKAYSKPFILNEILI